MHLLREHVIVVLTVPYSNSTRYRYRSEYINAIESGALIFVREVNRREGTDYIFTASNRYNSSSRPKLTLIGSIKSKLKRYLDSELLVKGLTLKIFSFGGGNAMHFKINEDSGEFEEQPTILVEGNN